MQETTSTTPKTMAQEMFQGMELLTSRPSGMVFDEYKALLKMQNYILRKSLAHKPSRRIQRLMEINHGYNDHPYSRRITPTAPDLAEDQGVRE